MTTATPRVGDVQHAWIFPILATVSVAVAGSVLYLTSYKNFYYDEWDFVSAYRPGASSSILAPHSEHWVTIPALIWKLLLPVFGLRSHVPYEAAALAAHLACVGLLFVLIRRRSGALPAFAAALILLVLGTGASNIVWAFQIAFTLPVAFGLLAMLVIDSSPPTVVPWRAGAISAALLCSVMSSGIGLSFLAAVTVQLVADGRRRRYLIALILPVAAFLAWFLLYGAGLAGTPGAPCPTCATALGDDIRSIGPGFIANFVAFVVAGIEASAAGVFGLAEPVGQVVLLILAGLLAWHWYEQKRIESLDLGLLSGLVALFAVIALGRTRFGLGRASDPHYVYVGVVYLLPLIAIALKRLPWRGLWRPSLACCLLIVVLTNAILLFNQAIAQTDLMRTENAELRTVELFRGAPDMAMNTGVDSEIMPQLTASVYFAAIDELGSAVPASTPRELSDLPADAVDREMVTLFGHALTVTPTAQLSTQSLPCELIDSTLGSVVDLQIADGRSFVMESSSGGTAFFSLGFLAPPSKPLMRVELPAGNPMQVRLPDTGRPVTWRLRIAAAAVGQLQVCGGGNLQVHKGGVVFIAGAAGGSLAPGWTSAADPAAIDGRAANLPKETQTDTFKNDVFGTPVALLPGTYDVWFRVRVADATGARPEMILGLWDVERGHWVGSTQLAADQLGTAYTWVKVATSVTPQSGHHVVFIASLANDTAPLTTDWYIDEAVVVVGGSPPPS